MPDRTSVSPSLAFACLHPSLPVVHSVVGVEVEELVVRVSVQRSHVTSLFVPVPMVVVGHHIDDVKVPGKRRNVVALVHHGLAGTDSCGEDPSVRIKCRSKLLHQC